MKTLCCREDAPPAAKTEPNPATEDKKTSGAGSAATDVLHEGKQDRKTPGVGNAATEVVEKPAGQASSTGGQQSTDDTADEDDHGHHHKKHKHKHHHDNDAPFSACNRRSQRGHRS